MLVVTLLTACAALPPGAPPPRGHLTADDASMQQPTPALPAQAPAPEQAAPPPQPPGPQARAAPPADPAPAEPAETYSVSVHKIPVEQLLFAIGRDAGLDLDLHPGLEGSITLNAIEQTLPQLLARIARQGSVRFELNGRHLVARPDTPFLRTYTLDYVNLSRSMRGTVATSTQIATSGSAMDGRPSTAGNASVTQIETRADNHFWETVEANVRAILEDQRRLPGRCTGQAAESCADASGDVMINRESGVLMVRANARQHAYLRAFLDHIQQAARRQVMIEATIVEVTLADGYRQGIDWTRLGLPGWSVRPRGSGDAGAAVAPTLSYVSGNVDLRLELLETFGTVKVLSSPRLSVLNNQTAMLKVVEEVVYFLVEASTTEYDDRDREKTTASTTPQSVSVGMVMSVTPQISAVGEITLNVRPTISGISGFRDDPNPSLGSIPNRVPQIRTREIESVLRLRSGEIAVLGGLMEDKLDHDTGRIPFIGELPLLGEAFTRRDNNVRRTELLIFLRPLLIEDPSTHGDYRGYARHLPDEHFLATGPSPGQRNFPDVPLRPVLDAGAPAPRLLVPTARSAQ